MCPVVVALPAGSFLMGAPADEPGRYPEDGDPHRVRVGAFAIGKFDVTRGEWAAFVHATNRATTKGCVWTARAKGMDTDPQGSWQDVGFAQDDSHPVVCVSWQDGRDYAAWLSRQVGCAARALNVGHAWAAECLPVISLLPASSTVEHHQRANHLRMFRTVIPRGPVVIMRNDAPQWIVITGPRILNGPISLGLR
jgi:hypothetical protein